MKRERLKLEDIKRSLLKNVIKKSLLFVAIKSNQLFISNVYREDEEFFLLTMTKYLIKCYAVIERIA